VVGRDARQAVLLRLLPERLRGQTHAANSFVYGYRRPWKAMLRAAGESVGRDRVLEQGPRRPSLPSGPGRARRRAAPQRRRARAPARARPRREQVSSAVAALSFGTKRLHHPVLGLLELDHVVLQVAEDHDQKLVTFAASAEDQRRIAQLLRAKRR